MKSSHSLCLFLGATTALCLPSPSINTAVVKSYTCLGDSYAAGTGAGQWRFSRCGRFSDSYPLQVVANDSLSISPRHFRNLACGGATTQEVLRQQVPYIGDADVVTLTAGGNEVDFSPLLNQCVYQWRSQVDCEGEITKVRGMIQSSSLINNVRGLTAAAAKRLKPGALLLVTGYARFFNDETDLCNKVTFSRTRPLELLTKERRRVLNNLVIMLNQVIKSTAEVSGAIYVDMDEIFEGHRFCEEGVLEPDLGRKDTWFFNLPKPEIERGGEEEQHGQVPLRGRIDLEEHWLDLESIRAFHPTSLGHAAIAKEVVRLILEHRPMHAATE